MIDLNKKNPNTRQKTVVIVLLVVCLVLGLLQLFLHTEPVIPTATENNETEVKQAVEAPITQVTQNKPDSCQKTRCSDFSSCEEARFYQTQCALKLDKDHDGIPCEGTLCEHK